MIASPTALIIGSGFGGLAAAIRLKAKGYEVTIVERQPDLGGRARVSSRRIHEDGRVAAPGVLARAVRERRRDHWWFIRLYDRRRGCTRSVFVRGACRRALLCSTRFALDLFVGVS